MRSLKNPWKVLKSGAVFCMNPVWDDSCQTQTFFSFFFYIYRFWRKILQVLTQYSAPTCHLQQDIITICWPIFSFFIILHWTVHCLGGFLLLKKVGFQYLSLMLCPGGLTVILTHLLLGISLKNTFEASQAIFWSFSGYKELKLTTKPFAGHTLHDGWK